MEFAVAFLSVALIFVIIAYLGAKTKPYKAVQELHDLLVQEKLVGRQTRELYEELKLKLDEKTTAYDTLLGQKKSSEVKVGFLAEQLLPLHEAFPVKPDTCVFLGRPLDYISFDLENDRIVFIEVKSNGSVLSARQKKIRQLVLDKKIEFAEVRIGEKGLTVK